MHKGGANSTALTKILSHYSIVQALAVQLTFSCLSNVAGSVFTLTALFSFLPILVLAGLQEYSVSISPNTAVTNAVIIKPFHFIARINANTLIASFFSSTPVATIIEMCHPYKGYVKCYLNHTANFATYSARLQLYLHNTVNQPFAH